jgi:hypothetical protein
MLDRSIALVPKLSLTNLPLVMESLPIRTLEPSMARHTLQVQMLQEHR